MEINDLDKIDQLALATEILIKETEEFLDDLPEFAPRSNRSRKMEKAMGTQ